MRPRVLRGNNGSIDLSTSILHKMVKTPILVAPSAMQRMATPLGEIANAKACAKAQTIMCLSSLSTTSLEDVAAADPSGLYWFQLYVYYDRQITEQLVRRAEKAGFKALVLTVDTPILGRREADIRNGFSLPPHLQLANFHNNSILGKMGMAKEGQESGLMTYISNQIDQTLSWNHVDWLRSITNLPIVLKGIQTGEDAEMCVKKGIDAIWVSNHGARQLDGVSATIDILPEVMLQVQKSSKKIEVYVDGGVRRGTDVFKALALGATAVFIGRPVLWALAANGEEGVTQLLQMLNNELTTAMILSGCNSLKEITSNHVSKQIPSNM